MPFRPSPDAPASDPVTESATPRVARRRRLVRGPLLALVAVGIALLTAGCLPPLLDPPTSGLSYGKGPLDAIRDAADRTTSTGPYSNCGLSSTELAAMMMVPTYFEAGGPSPSPMTLSRWDNVRAWSLNANLFAFGRTDAASPYLNAFFSPGIGMWQFDSAGGWDLTAADAIDSVTAANTAAATIAYRWCFAPSSRTVSPQARRQYAWGPWFGCTSGTQCEDRFQALVTNGSLNTGQDLSVGRYGGMEQRTCTVAGLGTGLTCWYVDPSRSQGAGGWKAGTYDPARPDFVTPLPKPFYVVRANDREYRFWLRADTGYDIGITGSHPVTTNARTSMTWEARADLCDTTAFRGECGGFAPVGVVDAVTGGTNSVRVAGWAFDRDTSGPIPVHVYVGAVGTAISTGGSRPDVAAVFPGVAGTTGYDAVVPSGIGPQRVCVYAIDVGGGPGNVLLGCRDVVVTGTPQGSLDVVTGRPGTIEVGGWSFLPGDPSSVAIVSVDGEVRGTFARTVARPDVVRAVVGADAASGFSGTVAASAGRRTVCLTTGTAPLGRLGCRVVDLPGGSPVGVIDSLTGVPGGVVVSGWAIDPDVASPIAVHVYVDGVGSAVVADRSRPDLTVVFPAYGDAHGFSARLTSRGGRVTVCAYGINVGLGAHSSLGCRTVDVPTGSPIGVLDQVVRSGSTVSGSGWAIDPDTAAPVPVHVYVGPVGTAITANVDRPDIDAAFPAYGPTHGFSFSLPSSGPTSVCAYAIDIAGTGGNRLLGCRTV